MARHIDWLKEGCTVKEWTPLKGVALILRETLQMHVFICNPAPVHHMEFHCLHLWDRKLEYAAG